MICVNVHLGLNVVCTNYFMLHLRDRLKNIVEEGI
jgi:hypothetical protein